jgi:hypothetical protein
MSGRTPRKIERLLSSNPPEISAELALLRN